MTVEEFYNWCVKHGVEKYTMRCDCIDKYGEYVDTVDADEECLNVNNEKRTIYIIDFDK